MAVRVAIVGAGLTGSLLACYLARRGLDVTLYERRADPRSGQAERGRSINLAISERGLDALAVEPEPRRLLGRADRRLRGTLDRLGAAALLAPDQIDMAAVLRHRINAALLRPLD